jgi:hypothetical protein
MDIDGMKSVGFVVQAGLTMKMELKIDADLTWNG